MKVYNHLLDLRSLQDVYHVHNELGNFSIGFCTTNSECYNSDSNSCLFKENDTVPLSGALDTLQYYDDSNTLKVRGKYRDNDRSGKYLLHCVKLILIFFFSVERVLEILIKCDWTKTKPELTFLKTTNRFKMYHFEMVTSYSCMKNNFSEQVMLNFS